MSSLTPSSGTIILGHSGFIGRHLVSCHQEHTAQGLLPALTLPKVDLRNLDQTQSLAPLLTPGTSLVLCSGIKRQWGDTLEIFRQNMAMIENLCLVLEKQPVQRVIFMSSAAVYGEDVAHPRISEQTPIRLATYYAISKYAAECLLQKACAAHPATKFIALRPPLVYGNGDTSKGYGPAGFLDSIASDKEITLWGDGSELREFLYVRDLARITCELLRSNFSGILNPIGGTSASFQELLAALAHLCQKTPRVAPRERSKAKVDVRFDGELLKLILPSFEFTPLADGLREMIQSENRTEKKTEDIS